MTAHFQTDWCSPPGATIRDVLNERKLGLNEFADLLGQSYAFVEQLLSGDLPINQDLAICLADVIGASPRFWLQRETDYRTDQMRLKATANNVRKEWLANFPIAEMSKFGWIPTSRILDEKFANCLEFFGVKSITEWGNSYSHDFESVAFRTSGTFSHDHAATAAWLRFGEIKAGQIQCQGWNKAKFKLALQDIRKLTRVKDPNVFLPILRAKLAECGVALVTAPTPTGCRASGATRFLVPEKAMMLLSFRYKSDDHFWFTFFHEAAHLALHDSSHLFLEGSGPVQEKEEQEANSFSQDMLLSAENWEVLHRTPMNYKAIIRFAAQSGTSPGIVVGQLQFKKIIDNKKFNFLKRRYDWAEIDKANL